MESRAKFMGHPLHPMLIVFPLGLFVTSVIVDIAYLITGSALLPAVSFYNIAGGVLGGLLAAVFGFRDWLAIPGGTRAKRIGAWHGIGNLFVTILFAISWILRRDGIDYVPGGIAITLSLLAVMVATLTGWLGGELVDRLGVGVDRGAHLDAISSLSGQPADHTLTAAAAVPVTGGEKYQEKHIEKEIHNHAHAEMRSPQDEPDADDRPSHTD